MRIALINENSQGAKNPIIEKSLKKVVEPMGFTVDNYGMYTDITLLRNTDKRCRQPYHNEISCHFGDYAAHLHAGTWRTGI